MGMKNFKFTIINEIEYTFEMNVTADNEDEAIDIAEDSIDAFLNLDKKQTFSTDQVEASAHKRMTNQIVVSSWSN